MLENLDLDESFQTAYAEMLRVFPGAHIAARRNSKYAVIQYRNYKDRVLGEGDTPKEAVLDAKRKQGKQQ